MKKVMILLAALAVGAMATAQEVTIKRGKATMSEADYHMLKQKADAYEATKKALDETLASYQKQQQLNDMYRPVELKTFNDSASYAIGKDIYQNWMQQNLGINGEAAGQSMIDCYKGQNRWDEATMRPLLNRFQEAFEKIRDLYAANDAKNRQNHPERYGPDFRRVIEVELVGEGAGWLYIETTGQGFRVEPWSYHDADAHIKCSYHHLMRMMRGETTAPRLFMKGRLKITGNLAKGFEIKNLLSAD